MRSYDIVPEINGKRYIQVEYEMNNDVLFALIKRVKNIKKYHVSKAQVYYRQLGNNKRRMAEIGNYRHYFNNKPQNLLSCLFVGYIDGEKMTMIFDFRRHRLSICGIDFKTIEQLIKSLQK